ncbi:hypothetical protein ASG80_19280 [Agromyces sp. Soil535]|nr:hypothetical protein ASG80_19280 [Agromyces sp. Soil535]
MHASALFQTLEDLAVISSLGAGTILYDRRFDHDSGLSENLRAVAIATSLGVKSIDKVRRDYEDHQFKSHDTAQPARSRYVHAYRVAQRHVEDSLDSLETNPDASLTLGMYAGAVALQRLKFSMFAAHLLYQLRLRYEADSVARHVLEQIAWAVAVAGFTQDDQMARVQPQKTIGKLTALCPEAGPLYGALSDATHAGMTYHLAVFETNENERGIIRHGLTDWTGSAATILTLADLWVVAHEYTQGDHLKRIVSTDRDAGYRPTENRPFLTAARAIVQEIIALEANPPD